MINKINWTRLINDILKSDRNIDIKHIARMVGLHRSSIARLRTYNIDPRHSTGEALIALWRSSTNQPHVTPPHQK